MPALIKVLRESQRGRMLRNQAARSLGEIGDPSAFWDVVKVFRERKAPVVVRSREAHGVAMFRKKKHVNDIPLRYVGKGSAV